jgi:hypothetical protein
MAKGTGDILQDAIPFSKGKQKLFKKKLGLQKPTAPGESPEEAALRARQREEMARLDEEENRRIKLTLQNRQAPGMFRGARRAQPEARTRSAYGAGARGGMGAGTGAGNTANRRREGRSMIP